MSHLASLNLYSTNKTHLPCYSNKVVEGPHHKQAPSLLEETKKKEEREKGNERETGPTFETEPVFLVFWFFEMSTPLK